MKIIIRALCVVLVAWLPAAHAANLTGTSSIVYQNAHYVFRNLNNATGYVRLNNGFTILAGQTAALDTFITVSGAIDLRTTGSLDLRSDVYLASNITFSTGGVINGRTNAIHLGDDVSLPSDSVFRFISNTIIDGNNQNALIFQPHAQLLLESRVSLTLKNMTIRTTRNSPHIPIINCFDQRGHVTLDNVTLELADDFPFRAGRLFFRNDVRFTGTSCFTYQSCMESSIMSRSSLMFDPGMTFYYYPSSDRKDLIQLTDKSSSIVLKGSGTTLQSTNTGLRLTKGRLFLDNKVTLSTRANTVPNGFVQVATASYGTQVDTVDWSPNGRYLAVGGVGPTNTLEFQIYRFDGSALTYVTGDNWAGGGAEVYCVRWHPNGRLIAVSGDATNDVRIYTFDGTNLTTLRVIDVTATGRVPCVAWNPAGNILALGVRNDTALNELRLYAFNGGSLSLLQSQDWGAAAGSFVNDIAWHPGGGHFFAVGSQQVDLAEQRLYSFNGASFTELASLDFGNSGVSTEFSPDGSYIALTQVNAAATAYILHIHRFNGTSFTSLVTINNGGSFVARWSPDGMHLIAGGTTSAGGTEIKLYRFTRPSTLTVVAGYDYGTAVNGVAWSKDGKYVAIGGNGPSGGHDEIEVYSVAYRFDTSTQPLSNGIVLGNAASGATFDLDTAIFGGSRVELYGRLLYDSFS
ncbi:hypothetical protein K2W90_00720 [Candidatus Babeliales bacterium]|nr:hypothetical protein [Candidatus Babeliales bacterium]